MSSKNRLGCFGARDQGRHLADATREAMEGGPAVATEDRSGDPVRLQPFVSAQHVAARRLSQAETAHLARAADLRDLRTILNLYGSTIASAKTAILDVVPGAADDAL